MSDYEKIYDEFWKDIVEKNGVVDMDQVKRELADYSILLDEVPIVYMHVTGGRISKPNTCASAVIAESDDYINTLIAEHEKEEMGDGKAGLY